jgi:hypothetical protein
VFTHLPIYPKFSATKETQQSIGSKKTVPGSKVGHSIIPQKWVIQKCVQSPPEIGDLKFLNLTARDDRLHLWTVKGIIANCIPFSVLLTVVQNCSRCKIYLWRKVVCLFDRKRSPNAHSASCHTLSMVGELSMSKGCTRLVSWCFNLRWRTYWMLKKNKITENS